MKDFWIECEAEDGIMRVNAADVCVTLSTDAGFFLQLEEHGTFYQVVGTSNEHSDSEQYTAIDQAKRKLGIE